VSSGYFERKDADHLTEVNLLISMSIDFELLTLSSTTFQPSWYSTGGGQIDPTPV